MNKKTWILIAFAIVLIAVYIFHFSGWFKPKVLAIAHNGRFGHINFTLGTPFQLTSLKVVPVSALQSNNYALPVWELKSDSNSVPTKMFSYGENIRGMKPALGTVGAEPLEPGATYRLYIEAGSLKAEHDFVADAAPRPPNRAR
jgi:hypothetical protein